MSEPEQFIVFINGTNIGTFKSLSETTAAAGQAAGRGIGGNGNRLVEVRNSKTFQIVSQYYI